MSYIVSDQKAFTGGISALVNRSVSCVYCAGVTLSVGQSHYRKTVARHGTWIHGTRELRFVLYSVGAEQPRRFRCETRVPSFAELLEELNMSAKANSQGES